METLLSALFLLNKNISIYGFMFMSPVVIGRLFVWCRAMTLTIFPLPTLVFLWSNFERIFFHTRPSMNFYPLGQLRMYWFPPHTHFFFLNVLAFTSTTCRVLSIQTSQNIIAYSISSDKTVLRDWIKRPCACVALWLVGFVSVFKINLAFSLHINN